MSSPQRSQNIKVFESLSAWKAERDHLRKAQRTLGFVPTMGALHEGHLTLVDRARAENDHVTVSIFVNPTQFNNADDLKNYPRSVNRDVEMLATRGVDALLLPNEQEIYRDQYRFRVCETIESSVLEGAYRAGHFDGVLTVLAKLFNVVQPDRCYMGEKDFQQFQLVHDMAKAMFLPIEIIPCPTVREPSGLAMSSRNERLSKAARAKAAEIFQAISTAADSRQAKADLERQGFKVDYVEEKWNRRLAAVWLEGVRLIDNVKI